MESEVRELCKDLAELRRDLHERPVSGQCEGEAMMPAASHHELRCAPVTNSMTGIASHTNAYDPILHELESQLIELRREAAEGRPSPRSLTPRSDGVELSGLMDEVWQARFACSVLNSQLQESQQKYELLCRQELDPQNRSVDPLTGLRLMLKNNQDLREMSANFKSSMDQFGAKAQWAEAGTAAHDCEEIHRARVLEELTREHEPSHQHLALRQIELAIDQARISEDYLRAHELKMQRDHLVRGLTSNPVTRA